MRRKLIPALVAASLLVGASAAPAQSAQALSLGHSGAAAQGRESELGSRRGLTTIVVALAVIAILAFVIVELGKNHPLPDSP